MSDAAGGGRAIAGDLQTVPGSGPTTEPPSIGETMEQIRVQTQVAPPDDGAGKAAPATHQYMIVMRHGQRIDEVGSRRLARAAHLHAQQRPHGNFL